MLYGPSICGGPMSAFNVWHKYLDDRYVVFWCAEKDTLHAFILMSIIDIIGHMAYIYYQEVSSYEC